MDYSDLLDVDTWAQVKKLAPKVTEVPYDVAVLAVEILEQYMSNETVHTDLNGKKFFEASLKKLIEMSQFEYAPAYLGRALRSMGLTLFRKADGYHAAWSAEQFEILKKYLKISVEGE
jgi:hypothetical protein